MSSYRTKSPGRKTSASRSSSTKRNTTPIAPYNQSPTATRNTTSSRRTPIAKRTPTAKRKDTPIAKRKDTPTAKRKDTLTVETDDDEFSDVDLSDEEEEPVSDDETKDQQPQQPTPKKSERSLIAYLKKGVKSLPSTFLYSVKHLPESVQEYMKRSKKDDEFYGKAAEIILKRENSLGGPVVIAKVFAFVTFLYTIILGVLWAGLYKYASSKNTTIQKLEDFFYGEEDAPIPVHFARETEETAKSIWDTITNLIKSTSESQARVFAESAKEIFNTLMEKSGLPSILYNALTGSFVFIVSNLIYTLFIRKSPLGFCESIFKLISFSITLAILLQINYYDKDILKRRTIQYFALFLIVISVSTTLTRWMFGMCIGLIINPQENRLTEMYQILMDPETWSNDSKRTAYLDMRNALLAARHEVYEKPITRSDKTQGKQPVVTITPPKKPTAQRSYKSLKHVSIETKNMFIRLFGWVLTSAGSLFGRQYNIEQLQENAKGLTLETEPQTPEDRTPVNLLDQ